MVKEGLAKILHFGALENRNPVSRLCKAMPLLPPRTSQQFMTNLPFCSWQCWQRHDWTTLVIDTWFRPKRAEFPCILFLQFGVWSPSHYRQWAHGVRHAVLSGETVQDVKCTDNTQIEAAITLLSVVIATSCNVDTDLLRIQTAVYSNSCSLAVRLKWI